MSDKNGWISDATGFIDQNTHDCIEVVGGFIGTGVED